jgi:hypothetical protein
MNVGVAPGNSLNVGVPKGPPKQTSFYGGVSPGLSNTATNLGAQGTKNPFDIIRAMGDLGQLQDATQEEKNIYAQMLEQRQTDAKVANSLKGIVQQQKMAPGFRGPSFFAQAPTNTLLTLIGNK